jgi:dTDP-4-dehydrorhamnose 3,5-epimerase
LKVIDTPLADLLIVEPTVHRDDRGHFFESFNARSFAESAKVSASFVQDNRSRSLQGVLRGIHYQVRQAQGKLVSVVSGEVFDVAVDLRRSSPTYGRWFGTTLSGENHRMMWIPEGFGHAFLTLSESADVLYKTTDYYAPAHERCVRWDDPDLAIDWPALPVPLRLSPRDSDGAALAAAETFP